jgi:hypothetical protein
MRFLITTVKRLKFVSVEDSRYMFIIFDAKRIRVTQFKISLLLSGFIKTKSVGIRNILKPIYERGIIFPLVSSLPYVAVLQYSNVLWFFPYS